MIEVLVSPQAIGILVLPSKIEPYPGINKAIFIIEYLKPGLALAVAVIKKNPVEFAMMRP